MECHKHLFDIRALHLVLVCGPTFLNVTFWGRQFKVDFEESGWLVVPTFRG